MAQRPAVDKLCSVGGQYFKCLVGMVPNHDVACSEALVQIHRLDQLLGHADAERSEFIGQRTNDGPVQGRFMKAVVVEVIIAGRPALLAEKHLQEKFAQGPVVAGHYQDRLALVHEPDVVPAHDAGSGISKIGRPSITAASLSKFSQTTPAN